MARAGTPRRRSPSRTTRVRGRSSTEADSGRSRSRPPAPISAIRGFVFQNSPYNSGGNIDIYGHHLGDFRQRGPERTGPGDLHGRGQSRRSAPRQLDPQQRPGRHPPEPRDLPAGQRPSRRQQRHPRSRQGLRDPGLRSQQPLDHHGQHGDGRRTQRDRRRRQRRGRQHPRGEQRLRLQRPLRDLARLDLPHSLPGRSQRRRSEIPGARRNLVAPASTTRAVTGRPIRCSSTTQPATCMWMRAARRSTTRCPSSPRAATSTAAPARSQRLTPALTSARPVATRQRGPAKGDP